MSLSLLPTTGANDDVDRVRQAAVDGFVAWTTADDDPVLGGLARTGLPVAIQGGPARPGLQHPTPASAARGLRKDATGSP